MNFNNERDQLQPPSEGSLAYVQQGCQEIPFGREQMARDCAARETEKRNLPPPRAVILQSRICAAILSNAALCPQADNFELFAKGIARNVIRDCETML